MKSLSRFFSLAALFSVVLAGLPGNSFAAAAKNLVAGVAGPVTSNTLWNGYSALNTIYGSSLYTTNASTVFYLGFVGGSTVDISNMVVYKTTARGSLKIASVTPVKLGGVSNPSINLTSTSVCPVQPVSVTNPCIVRLDPTVLALSPLNDYTLAVFFTNDSNNQTTSSAVGSTYPTSLTGGFLNGDETQLTVGQSLPALNGTGHTYFLMYVMTN